MKSTALALLLVLSMTRIALADPPPAQFTLQFDGDAAIWNPFDGFEACETVTESGITATLCLALDNVFCDGAGNCSCDAAFEIFGELDGLLTGPCTAKVSCAATPDNPTDNVCKAKLALDASGSVESCDAELRNFVVNGPVDYTGFYRGKARTSLCVDCGGGQRVCGGVAGLFEYAVNPPIPWDLTVQVAPDPENPNTLVGDAADSLGFEYTAKGKYNSKTDESTIVLKGVTEKADPLSISQGAKVKLEHLGCAGSQCIGGTADAKVQGNKINDAPLGP